MEFKPAPLDESERRYERASTIRAFVGVGYIWSFVAIVVVMMVRHSEAGRWEVGLLAGALVVWIATFFPLFTYLNRERKRLRDALPVRVGTIMSCEVHERSDTAFRVSLTWDTDGGEGVQLHTTVSPNSAWQNELLGEGRHLVFRRDGEGPTIEVDWKETRRRFGKAAEGRRSGKARAPTAIVCPRCGAPLETATENGATRCDYCDVQVRL